MIKIQSLDQYRHVAADTYNSTAKVTKNFKSENSILSRLWDFASSVPEFRRNGKGNIRHRLDDAIILMLFARMSKCVSRKDIIEYGRQNPGKFQKMGLLKNGVPPEPTLCRIENGIDDLEFADRMREFAEWFQCGIMMMAGVIGIICVDGKAARCVVYGSRGINPFIRTSFYRLAREIKLTVKVTIDTIGVNINLQVIPTIILNTEALVSAVRIPVYPLSLFDCVYAPIAFIAYTVTGYAYT